MSSVLRASGGGRCGEKRHLCLPSFDFLSIKDGQSENNAIRYGIMKIA